VVDLFERTWNGQADAADAAAALEALSLPGGLVNGYAHRRPGLERMPA